MLRALELSGFKSFADRTRFEFPPGVTVIVGPNGSGKSNVVDAVKWVLGAQSVKALRGKERSDVIFSGAAARRPAGAAEVSLYFDAAMSDAEGEPQQVSVSRRLYRSGETEYLVNRRACRLRDVRDALADAGVASGAYSIIEQGKVDALLQSSPGDRRAIFEEAAGISRFKTKRQEAARRLERVEQNLARLADIVEELQSRLTRVQSQAGKAQKHQDAAGELRQLVVQVAYDDWTRLTAQIEELDARLEERRTELARLEEQVATADATIAARQQKSDQLQASLGELLASESSLREQIAQSDTKRQSQLARIEELRDETARLARHLLTMTSRAGDSQQLVVETAAALAEAEAKFAEAESDAATHETQLARVQAEWEEAERTASEAQTQLERLGRQADELENEQRMLTARLEAAAVANGRRESDLAELEQTHSRLAAEHATASELLRAATEAAASAADQLERRQRQVRATRSRQVSLNEQLAELQSRMSAARERVAVLDELERRLEGLNAGSKAALERARAEPDGPYGEIRGVVADLLHVDADSAHLIEIALGDRANYLVAPQASRLEKELTLHAGDLAGRLTLLRLDVPAPASAVDHVDLAHCPGVIGRADQFVEAAADLGALVRRLLGRHWLVDTLATALSLAAGPGRGLNFITVGGEVVGADGAISVGPRQSTAGMLSRRSELRALAESCEDLEKRIAANRAERDEVDDELASVEPELQQLAARHAASSEQAGHAASKEHALADRLKQTSEKVAGLTDEHAKAQADQQEQQRSLVDFAERLRVCRAGEQAARQQARAAGEAAAEHAATIETLRQSLTESRISLAAVQQRRDGLQREMQQLQRDHEERDRALLETRQRAEECVEARTTLEQSNEQLAATVQSLRAEKESLVEQVAELERAQQTVKHQRSEAVEQADRVRQGCFAKQQAAGRVELQKNELEHQRRAVCDRLAEAYEVDLAALAQDNPPPPLAQRSETEAEIRRLSAVLKNLGPVNQDAVEELSTLEARCQKLSEQYDDLQNARSQLARIVSQINTESRRIFAQTIEEVRGHFSELFVKLFGGGEADIIVENEDGQDLLECGIEIVARPPGKQPRSISLLSGGERTLTCVALLLGLFKNRPSPFCLLDEVDAALDEANIDRFVQVLDGLTDSTQFIIITHSKRTMACSNTLHGVTMQGTGISKRVSVRFDDVGHDGRIRPAALERGVSGKAA